MLGGFGRSSADHQHKVLALLNNPCVTDAQKAAYSYDNACCDRCAIRTVFIGPFKRRPLTNEKVLNGVCRACYPEQCGLDSGRPVSATPWDKIQKLAAPREVLFAKTSGAFSSLQTSVSKGINNLNDNIQSSDMTEKSKAFTDETSRAFTSLHASVTGSINTLNENIKKNTENMDVGCLQSGINNINTRRVQKKQSRGALSNLKNAFSTQGDGQRPKEHNDSNSIDPKDLKGISVSTPYGPGFVREYRQEDDMFVVELVSCLASPSSTKLYCKSESLYVLENKNKNQLNEAFEAMEKMRILNLELECQERGVAVDYSKCTQCLLNPTVQPQSFGRIRKLMKNPALACLFCGAPTCKSHSCPAMKKEGITACTECIKLFEPGYLVSCVNDAHGLGIATTGTEGREENPLEMMIDLYDRVLLLLRYSSQYIESIARELEENTKKYNNINAGASSTGIVSGALGVAAAAAIFTPAGPPLLIASLTLGAGATAAQTGTEIKHQLSEPNKFADKILALSGMVRSLLKFKNDLREILTVRLLAQEGDPQIDRLKSSLSKLREKQTEAAVKTTGVLASTAILSSVVVVGEAGGIGGVAVAESVALTGAAEVGTIAGRQANMMTKSATAAARGARFARGLGGALSAATILLEARTLTATIDQIRLGNPCEKADNLRSILKEIPAFPSTQELDEECRIYIGALSNRLNASSLEDAITLIERQAKQEWQMTKALRKSEKQMGNEEKIAPGGASILDASEDDDSVWDSVTGVLSARIKSRPVSDEPPVPHFVEMTSGGNVASTPGPQTRQSMPQLPANHFGPQMQSALLDRIKKFKEEDK